ncbi:MAG: hypothetical protein A4S09_03580 [Proteobacteria bacterium SG_bin7]|nr:MAG: hypothetical protein A4S09_03580 [Proteobacteria bacterium SG_bin7]
MTNENKTETEKMPKSSPSTSAAAVAMKKEVNYQRRHISIKVKREVWKDAGTTYNGPAPDLTKRLGRDTRSRRCEKF